MESLPEEVVIMISEYLTGEDLASLCATNRACRELINTDIFWKHRCDLELAQYLRITKCVVEPSFVSPEVKGSGLSQICDFRLSYMRQNHLHNNYSQGRFKTFEMPLKTDSYRQPESCCVLYGNDLAITNGLPKRAIYGGFSTVELWDVKANPTLISEMEVLLARANLANTSSQVFQVVGSCLVIWDIDLVHVLKITPRSQKLQFKHLFYFHQEKKTTRRVKSYSSIYSNRDYINIDTKAILVGSTFLGSYSVPIQNKKMHLWNVETGEKLKEESYENCTFYKFFGNETPQSSESIVIAVQPSQSTYKILVYNVTQLAFKPFVVTTREHPEDSILLREYIAIHTFGKVDIYNVETNQLLKSIPTVKFTAFRKFEKRIVFYDKVGFRQFNTENEKVERLVKNKSPIGLFQIYHDRLFLFYDDDCYIDYYTTHTKVFFPKRTNKKVVRTLQLNICLSEFICSNQMCTKFLLCRESDLKKVLNFW